MNYETILVEKTANFVGIVTLNRPDQLNTFNTGIALELDSALKSLDDDPDVRVLLIRGAGRGFCAGIDVNEFFGKSTWELRDWIYAMEKPLITISELKKPVITQVHGPAVANGAGLVAASDLSVASEDARFGLTAINVGLSCLGPVIPVLRLMGRKRALELLLGGEVINAPKALEMGLVNRVVPKEALEEEAMGLAESLAAKSPLAIQLSKQAFYSAADLDYRHAFEYMNEAFARLCSTEDANEGVKAFLEKRAPSWKGR